MTKSHLAGLLERSAKRYPDRTAIIFGDTRLTYSQVDTEANRVANLLVERGVHPGDRVALSCPNLPYFAIAYFGIVKAGAVVIPLNILLKAREVAYHLRDSAAVCHLAFEGTPDLPIGATAREAGKGLNVTLETFDAGSVPWTEQPIAFETVERDPDDTAVILYTSGTTGLPKGAELSHRNIRATSLAAESMYDADADRPDTYLCVLPLFHAFGQVVVQNAAFAFGGTVVLAPRFEATSAIALMVREKVTFFAGVPTMYWGLLGGLTPAVRVEEIANNLRVASSGGAALPHEVHKSFQERFGVTILEGYGLSETSAITSFSVYGEPPRVGSVGKPIAGVEMRLINDDWSLVPDGDPAAVGEIAIRGDNILRRYHGRPEATAEAIKDGWFRSGDLARKDADGYYFIVDRSKDMIIRGGYNVYPRELEEELMTHPAVSLVAVIGVPHESHGEEVKAVIVPEPGAEVTAEQLLAWGRERFAAYKYPRLVELRDALPMTTTGKILKRELS